MNGPRRTVASAFSQLMRHRWLTLAGLALLLSGVLTYRLVRGVYPVAKDVLRILSEEWPAVEAAGDRFRLLDEVPSLYTIDLVHGWRVILDPEEEIAPDQIRPKTVVVQQGRFLLREPDGDLQDTTWRVGGDQPRTITRDSFRRLGRFLNGVVLLPFMLFFLGLLIAGLLLSALGAGFLLLLEFLGVWRAPPSPFDYAAAWNILPFVGYSAARFSGFRFAQMELFFLIGYLIALGLSWLWLKGEWRRMETVLE